MILLVLFILIQALDVVSTAIGIRRGADEAMLLPGWLFTHFGFWPSCIAIKLIGIALAAAATFTVRQGWIFTGGLCLIGIGVLINNWRVLRELKG